MPLSSDRVYEPLPNATSIRILILAPGNPDDSDLSFGLITSDLDFDHDVFPDSTPRPVQNLSFVTGKHVGEDDSQFPIYFDMDSNSTPQEPQLHPFQRYEALSYVWGDLSDPQYIFLEGDKPISVTRSLYSALRSLRLPQSGRKLWIDALCINQSDHEEKKIQLALMKRVYQQAEKVIAYLPMSAQDQRNINELIPKIMQASMLYREHQASRKEEESNQGRYTGPFNSISDLETKKISRNKNEPMSVTLANAQRDGKLYLESFGLPPQDSPLWDSWRRIFASPYFRRIWIWQEITLGNNLHFWFANGEGDAEPLFIAHHFLDEYSAVMNMSYIAAWCASDEDNQDTLKDRLVGSGNATTMYRERILRRYGRGGSQRRLIEKLATVGTFEATDPRDKIYALLGLTSDGASFAQHVSYAPWDSMEQTFVKFAKLFVERNEGIEVLLQAGIRDEKDEWPSWVPHWDNLERPVPVDAGKSPGKTSTRIQVDESSQTLNIFGTILDDISVVNNNVLEALQVTENGVNMWRFIESIISGLGMTFGALTTGDPEEVLEQLFYVLAQPKTRRERPRKQDLDPSPLMQENTNTLGPQGDSGSSATNLHIEGSNPTHVHAPSRLSKFNPIFTRQVDRPKSESSIPNTTTPTSKTASQQGTPSSGDEDEIARETEVLRTGFHEFINYVWTIKPQLDTLLSESEEPEEDTTQLIQFKSPVEFHAFQKRAIKNIHHRRLCVTKGERVGIASKRTKIGDKVAVFEGCDIHFVLRPVDGVPGEEAGGKGRQDGKATYRLVGPAFFNLPGSEAISSAEGAQSIRIV
ncbi:heterokaryon incompatibility protein-domain-containing protein [Ustulina deusta]|nr:heterokaryon incompatibility protein-domain-containing protein [Ustulina deusta]